MRIYHKCKEITPYTYDEKISMSEKSTYIKKYNLHFKGTIREYWIHNVLIISDGSNLTFNYVNDISITYDKENGYLIQDTRMETCRPFSFYKAGIESSYALYEAMLESYTLHMKDYGTHITFEVITKGDKCISLNKL